MKPVELTKDIYWIGAVDFNKRNFHGYSRSPQGTTYNSYLVCDEKNVIFDTVDEEYAGVMFCRLAKRLPVDKIDYIVINHTEKDHAGALSELVTQCKPEKIFTSSIGKKFLDAQFNTKDWPLEIVSTGDSISIGKRTVQFLDTRMLHWPDSMVSYIPEEKLLISNDIFGQNIATSERFADQCDSVSIRQRTQEYYYNIILPFSTQVIKTLENMEKMNLDIGMIAPDHGVIYRTREDCQNVLTLYREMAEQKPILKVVIVFETMWGSTKKMAYAIASGLDEEEVPYTIIDIQKNHHSDVMTALANASGIIIGSATHNNSYLPGIADLLHYMKGLRPKNLIGGGFGSFGWSGEAAKEIQQDLVSIGIETPIEPLRATFIPKHEMLRNCFTFGKTIAQALKEKCKKTI